MFDRSLRLDEHTRRYSVRAVDLSGWEVRLEEDRQLRRRELYRDWHRVERAVALFELEVTRLREHGWLVDQ